MGTRTALQNAKPSSNDFSDNIIERLELDRPKSKPVRYVETKTGKLKEFSMPPREYGILSHVWCGAPNQEVTWDKLNNTSVDELRVYLARLKESYDELDSAWSMLGDAGAGGGELLPRIESLSIKIEREFRIPFRVRNLDKQMEGKLVENFLQRVKKELMLQRPLEKVANALRAADQLGLDLLWVDTCCIKKSDSAELVESISYMGEWYSNAKFCLVYLNDIYNTSFSEISQPVWSTRGWTLQEIAMCKDVVFYNANWKKLEHKNCPLDDVYRICNVPSELFCRGGQVNPVNLAASYVMHYAGTRETAKEEDHAYSLMGILGVKIPITYGEGEEAAVSRLIDVIVMSKRDVSVFSWTGIGSGSKLRGKSMYPVRLSAFPACSPEQLLSPGSVIPSNAGIKTTFEILPMRPILEKRSYPQGFGGLPENAGEKCSGTDYIISCKGMKIWDTWVLHKFDIRCSLQILKREEEYLKQFDRPRTENDDIGSLLGSWVLARSIGLRGGDIGSRGGSLGSRGGSWFLCLLEMLPGSGYVGWRIPSSEFQLSEHIIHPPYEIQLCVR